jgi:hypothetical protein
LIHRSLVSLLRESFPPRVEWSKHIYSDVETARKASPSPLMIAANSAARH